MSPVSQSTPEDERCCFQTLVEDRNDLSGMVAYALYKEEKIAWVKRFAFEHGGRKPTQEEMRAFYSVTDAPHHIELYRTQANSILDSIFQRIFQTSMEKYADQLLLDAEKEKKEFIKSEVYKGLNPGLWRMGRNCLVNAFATSVMVIILSVLAWGVMKGPQRLVGEALQTYQQTDEQR